MESSHGSVHEFAPCREELNEVAVSLLKLKPVRIKLSPLLGLGSFGIRTNSTRKVSQNSDITERLVSVAKTNWAGVVYNYLLLQTIISG